MSLPIQDYAMIGDCETAALVGKNGSIDWLCFPRFDSGACFASLLGTPDNGRWLITPASKIKKVKRHYRPGTLILETDYETDSGAVTIIDWMPPRSGEVDLMRIVAGRRGKVPMRMDLAIRFDYGWIIPWVRHIERGIRATAGPDTVYCRSDVELRGENMHTVADFTVSEGQRIPFELVWCPTYGKMVPMEKDVEANLRETDEWWKSWSSRCSYRGEWDDAVLRSLITLKALTFCQTGGIVAAPTTSLPEKLGGVGNWDYRFCWLRDATFTLYALMIGGYTEEACAWREWLINAVAGKPSEIQLIYGLAGERWLEEMEVPWLPGYQDSHPVRVGNAAYHQHQLDVYGEVMDSLHLTRRLGLEASENAWRVQLEIMKFLESDWQEPDEGIWEVRGPRRHFTHSKVMAWVAMDRAVRAVEEFGLNGPLEKWRRLRQEIHDQVCREGFDSQLNSFVQYYGAKQTDASLLMLPLVGFLPAKDPRMLGTVEAIRKYLMEDGLVYRYNTSPKIDALPRGEGAFLICSFWMADNLALQGKHKEARDIFEQLLDLRNDVGLLSEQYDPESKRLLGNFPQAFSHVGLVNTARNLTMTGGPAEHRQR